MLYKYKTLLHIHLKNYSGVSPRYRHLELHWNFPTSEESSLKSHTISLNKKVKNMIQPLAFVKQVIQRVPFVNDVIQRASYVGPVIQSVSVGMDAQEISGNFRPLGAAKVIGGRVMKCFTPPALFLVGKCLRLVGGVIASVSTGGIKKIR